MRSHDDAHAEECDCSECCLDCGTVTSLNDDGECEDCALNRILCRADFLHDQMKEGL